MSEPAFDPEIERSYRKAPNFIDSELFDAEVEVKLYRRGLLRRIVMGLTGVACGLFILQQIVQIHLGGVFSAASGVTGASKQSVRQVMATSAEVASQLGLADVAVGGVQGAQLLLVAAAALSIALLSYAVRIAQSF